MSSGDWLYEKFVPGVAVPFAGQGPEQVWRAAILEHVRPAGTEPAHYGVSGDFLLSPGRDPDLDNLLAPLFSVVINKLGWFSGRRRNMRWFQATKTYASDGELGVQLRICRADLPPPLQSSPDLLLSGIYRGQVPKRGCSDDYAEWARETATRTATGEDRLALSLRISPYEINIGEIIDGHIKALIDGLWPVLGGTPRAPLDEQISALTVVKGVDVEAGSVAVNLRLV
jgi:hypothetical protein